MKKSFSNALSIAHLLKYHWKFGNNVNNLISPLSKFVNFTFTSFSL